MNRDRFSPIKHIPKYSRQVFNALRTPVVMYFGLVGNGVLLSCMALFYHFESPVNPNVHGWADAFWWAVVTMTTVGYGDVVPVTQPGRMAAIMLIMLGVAFFASFSALFVSVLFNITSRELVETHKDTESILAEIKRLSDKIDRMNSN